MADFIVDALLSAKGDGHTSMQEAFKAAVDKSIATGLEVTIRFSSAMDISLAKTLVIPSGAKIVINGAIEGDNTIETGSNDVVLRGDNGGLYVDNGQSFGHTMVKVAVGGSLLLSDVELADNLVVGADGKSGMSGDNGLNGSSGDNAGGIGGHGSDMIGFDGVGGANGSMGQTGAGAVAIG